MSFYNKVACPLYSGQRSAITGFINFLNKDEVHIRMPNKQIEFVRPRKSQNELKQSFIDALRLKASIDDNGEMLIRLAVGYLHGIEIPEKMRICLSDIKEVKGEGYFLLLAGEKLYVPERLI